MIEDVRTERSLSREQTEHAGNRKKGASNAAYQARERSIQSEKVKGRFGEYIKRKKKWRSQETSYRHWFECCRFKQEEEHH